MKRIICLLLSVGLLLGAAAGCSGQKPQETTVPDTAVTQEQETSSGASESPTENPSNESPSSESPSSESSTAESSSTESPAPEISSAASAYLAALEQTPENYRWSVEWETSRAMGKEAILTKDSRVLEVRGAGSPDMKASESWSRSVEGNAFSRQFQYQTTYAQGTVLLEAEKSFYMSRESAEEFLADRIPLEMLHLSKYETVEWQDDDHSRILFTDANDTEWEWLGMDCSKIHEIQGTVLLEEGRLSQIIYEASFALEGIEFAVHVTAQLSESSGEILLPTVKSTQMKSLDRVKIVPLLDFASCGFLTDGFTGDIVSMMLSQAAGSAILKQEWIGMDWNSKGLMLYNQTSQMDYISDDEPRTTELRYFDGKARYLENGEELQIPGFDPEVAEEEVLGYLFEIWNLPSEMENTVLSDETDCWLLEFDFTEAKAQAWYDAYEDRVFQGELKGYGVSYQPGHCHGYVSLDKGSGFPIHQLIVMEGTHYFGGVGHSFDYNCEWNFMPADPDAEYVITESFGASEGPSPTPLLYEVTSPEGGSMWLLGTIHIGDERSSNLPEELRRALLESDALAVEIDTSKLEELVEEDPAILSAYQKAMMYLDGSHAMDHVDEELGKELENAIKKYGGELYMTLLNYNLSTLTTYLEQVMLPLGRSQSYERGIDNQLVELAKQNEILVWDVEDYAEHLTLLANFSEELQRLMLKETLQSGRYSANLASAEMFELWCRGDEEEIFRAIEEETKEEEDITEEEKALTEEYNEAMMLKRNAQMLEKAKEYMASGQRVFFAVGLAHLTGEKGLVEGLKAAGYSLNQVKYAP